MLQLQLLSVSIIQKAWLHMIMLRWTEDSYIESDNCQW
jgi:hypothetical protein